MVEDRRHKLGWVADALFHPVPISTIEKKVISTEVFNRLHNILQNSTVYLTYPSDRISRFSHSIGCMHLSGVMFQNGILNSNEDTRTKFLDGLIEQIVEIRRLTEFQTEVAYLFSQVENTKRLQDFDCSEFRDQIYLSALPGVFEDNHHCYAFIVGYQAIRLAALLHDLGHPPYSHITEEAIGDIYQIIRIQESVIGRLSDRAKRFKDLVYKYRSENKSFHEALGSRLSKHILDETVKSYEGLARLCFDALTIKHVCLGIIEGKSPIFADLQRIYNSDLDSDRLDYVPRGLSMAGMQSSSVRYDRLLTSVKLILQSQNDQFSFVPSARALSSIEEFFNQRLRLYKYITYHHRVVKTDGLFRNAVVTLAIDYLLDDKPDDTSVSSHRLPNNISGLWHVLDPEQTLFPEQLVNKYIQWDDSWLLSILRNLYFELKQNSSEHSDEIILKSQLEEILSNKKNYYSVIKRVDSFMVIDNACLESVPLNYDWNEVSKVLDIDPDISLFLNITSYFAEFKQLEENQKDIGLSSLRERFGFFIVLLQRLLISKGVERKAELEFAQDAISRLEKKFNLDDAILIPKMLVPGVDRSLKLSMGDQVIELGSVSRLAEDLKLSSKLFPSFFIYVSRRNGFDDKTLQEMREFIGKALWQSFSDSIDSLKSGGE